MNAIRAIHWFKTTFRTQLEQAVEGTAITDNLLAAIAYQETGYIWSILVEKGLPLSAVLKLCVGDTIDARYKNGKNVGRKAFPKNKQELLTHPQGSQLFDIARTCLEEMSVHIPGYKGAVSNPAKFCRGFGIFQYDLQFCKSNAAYFLDKKWESMSQCLKMVIGELKAAMTRQGWSGKSALTLNEQVHVAIAYNRGKSILSKGYKQGHFDGTRYYGENVHEYLLTANAIEVNGAPLHEPPPGEVALPASEKPAAGGIIYRVDVSSALMLRSAPNKSSAILARLPAGQLVVRIDGHKHAEWFRVETSVNGALHRGFAFAEYLVAEVAMEEIPVMQPVSSSAEGPQAVYCPRQSGTITRRTDAAGARSLNEKGQPGRTGSTAAERVTQLGQIIAWLDVPNSKYKRYWPSGGKTFCNIYAHDYCHLAGVYLPRVWWTGPALVRIGQGENVAPLIGDTIDEQRANDLFRWLKGFGTSFGWRETASLTELQQAANLGAVCLIIARRKADGKSGHVVMVVPELEQHKATRNTAGEVTNPLQSQAGERNFSYGKGSKYWWKGERFAENAFWVHA